MTFAVQEMLRCPFNRTEAKVVQLYANGMTAKDSASVLGLSIHTVNSAIQQAKLKARANNLPHLVAESLRHGWVD